MPKHPHDELCALCGLTFGSHRGDWTERDQCPAHEGRMDWAVLPVRGVPRFVGSGRYEKIEDGTPATWLRRR